MRLPVLPPAVPEFDLDRYEIAPKAALSSTKDVTEEVVPVAPVPSRQGGAETRTSPESTPSAAEPQITERSEADRRIADRRVRQVPVLLDTRTGVDRRKGSRRRDDPVLHIREKA